MKIDKFTGQTTSVGYPSTYDGESLVYWPASDRLFTFNANRLVWIDPATGASTQIGPNPSQIMNGSLGALTVRDIDGLTFDATVTPPILYASFRRDGTGANDVLLIVNTNDGLFVSNAFGPGNDYLVVQNLATTTSSGMRLPCMTWTTSLTTRPPAPCTRSSTTAGPRITSPPST